MVKKKRHNKMGFFSWRCAKSDKPVMAEVAVRNTPWAFASGVVVLFKNGDRVRGTYDGYGRVDEFELIDYPEERWRMVIEKFYDGETFEQLAQNKYDQGQGFFYNDGDLEQEFGVKQ
jgi:hypothetical protein